MTAMLHVGGQRPYPLIVDNGSERTTISRTVVNNTGAQESIRNFPLIRQLVLAKRIAIQSVTIWRWGRRSKIEAVTGQVKSVEMSRVKRLDLGRVELQDMMVAFAGSRIFKGLGYPGKPAILLGTDAIRSFDKVSIDFAQKKGRFGLPEGVMCEQ